MKLATSLISRSVFIFPSTETCTCRGSLSFCWAACACTVDRAFPSTAFSFQLPSPAIIPQLGHNKQLLTESQLSKLIGQHQTFTLREVLTSECLSGTEKMMGAVKKDGEKLSSFGLRFAVGICNSILLIVHSHSIFSSFSSQVTHKVPANLH